MTTYAKTIGFGLLAALGATGCGPKSDAPKADAAKAESKKAEPAKEGDHHTHGQGPNGGVIFDLGKNHAEFTVDHDRRECALFIMGGDENDLKPMAVAAKELTLTTKPTKTKDGKAVPAMTIAMLPKDAKDGKAVKFVGTDPGLGNVADFAGTVLGEIDGKPSQGEFKE